MCLEMRLRLPVSFIIGFLDEIHLHCGGEARRGLGAPPQRRRPRCAYSPRDDTGRRSGRSPADTKRPWWGCPSHPLPWRRHRQNGARPCVRCVFTGRRPLPHLEARGTSQTLRQAPRPGSALQVPAQELPRHLHTAGRTFSHKLPLTPGHVPSLGTATDGQQLGCLATVLVGLGRVLCPRIPEAPPVRGPLLHPQPPQRGRGPSCPRQTNQTKQRPQGL